jgi:hypothetical protein
LIEKPILDKMYMYNVYITGETMFRSQIYLTKTERTQLHELSLQTGRSQSELIRQAIDLFIEINLKQAQNKLAAVKAIKGIWSDRDDLPDFEKIRNEFDR